MIISLNPHKFQYCNKDARGRERLFSPKLLLHLYWSVKGLLQSGTELFATRRIDGRLQGICRSCLASGSWQSKAGRCSFIPVPDRDPPAHDRVIHWKCSFSLEWYQTHPTHPAQGIFGCLGSSNTAHVWISAKWQAGKIASKNWWQVWNIILLEEVLLQI